MTVHIKHRRGTPPLSGQWAKQARAGQLRRKRTPIVRLEKVTYPRVLGDYPNLLYALAAQAEELRYGMPLAEQLREAAAGLDALTVAIVAKMNKEGR